MTRRPLQAQISQVNLDAGVISNTATTTASNPSGIMTVGDEAGVTIQTQSALAVGKYGQLHMGEKSYALQRDRSS